MRSEVIELEKILDREIEAYSKLEKYIIDKKESLINGDIEKLRDIDCEIEIITSITGDLESKRSEVSSRFGDENLSLKEIIERIEEEDKVKNITNRRSKLKNLVDNIQRQNNINAKLIEHSLKLVEFSVNSIANALLPEMSAYNNQGKIQKSRVKTEIISSVIHEA